MKKNLIIFFKIISYYYWVLFLFFLIIAINPLMYNFNSNLSDVKVENKNMYYQDLAKYLFHIKDLNLNNWNQKEISHYNEVRKIFDFLFILYLINLYFFLKYKIKEQSKLYSKYSIFITLLIILVFVLSLFFNSFRFFWDNIFHPFLFSNNLWLMNPDEVSFYLFPINFFVYTISEILLGILVFNIYVYYREKNSFFS